MFIRRFHKLQNLARSYELSAEVKEALASQKPVVALESAIITHGMPYPHNVNTAFKVEDIVRQQNAVPATIGIIKGRIKIGLTKDEITSIGCPDNAQSVIKASRRDLAYIVSKGLSGGTTVSATIIAAYTVGIKVFITGGVGGVHRGGQDTLDISADLTELGRNPVAVVCSGIKSILDIGRTLEYLETQGVCVATFGQDKEFPAFYTRQSGHKSPYNVDNVHDAAALIASIHKLRLKSGVLLAVPVPAHDQHIDNETIEKTIQQALKEGEKKGIKGKEITPFVLSHIMHLTEGLSLQTNIGLIKNNALVGAQVAVELHKIMSCEEEQKQETQLIPSLSMNKYILPAYRKEKRTPIVVGASIVDSVVRMRDTFKVEPQTLKGCIQQSGGGVGRNIADALGKLHVLPRFVSAVGSDPPGNYLLSQTLKNVNCDGVLTCKEEHTASYIVVIDETGEFRFGVGDMDIHRLISAQHVEKHLHDCPMVIFDGNLPEETITSILKFCINKKIPAVFEPTDIPKSVVPFKTEMWKHLHLISPNIRELRQITSMLGISPGSGSHTGANEIIQEAMTLATPLAKYINIVMVTLGSLGILIVQGRESGATINGRLYTPLRADSIVSVSGAGDCAVAGIIAGQLARLPEAECVSIGLAAAYDSLHHSSAVPPAFTTSPQQVQYFALQSS